MRSAKFVARLAVATLTVLMLVATVAPAQSATLRTWYMPNDQTLC